MPVSTPRWGVGVLPSRLRGVDGRAPCTWRQSIQNATSARRRPCAGWLKFKGCYRLESQLPKRKIYGGGVFGANIDEAIRMAT